MILIKRDLIISSAIVAACFLALAWFFLLSPGFTDTSGPHGLALVLGGLGVLLMTPMWLNFLKAGYVHRSLVSGKGVIGRWQLSPEQVSNFAEKKRDHMGKKYRMLWHPSKREQRNGAEVVFGAEAVCIGGRILFLPTAGIQSIRGIWLEPDYPRILSIWVRSFGATRNRVYSYDETLRVPVGSTEAWLTVVTHYRQALAGKIVVAPYRWVWRVRIGIALMVILPILGVYGWYLANQPWRNSEEDFIWPFVFMLLGIMGTIGAGIIVFVSRRFRERQHGFPKTRR